MGTLLDSLNAAFLTMELSDKDQPAMELARIYAKKIEQAQTKLDDKTLKDLGPELMRLLAELLMTPKARASIKSLTKEGASDDTNSPAAATFARLRNNASS